MSRWFEGSRCYDVPGYRVSFVRKFFPVADTAASGLGVGGLAFTFDDGTMILHDPVLFSLALSHSYNLTYPIRVITPFSFVATIWILTIIHSKCTQ